MAPRKKAEGFLREALIMALKRDCLDEDGKPTKRLHVIASKLVDLAANGDTGAIREVFDRVEGKPSQSVDANISDTRNVRDLTTEEILTYLSDTRTLESEEGDGKPKGLH